jgi:type IV pilus assembly protein PilB
MRLHHLGIKLYDLASTVSLILAQRLARRLCDHCKRPSSGKVASPTTFQVNPNGCSKCSRGHQGRIGIFELMPTDDPIMQALHSPENYGNNSKSCHQLPVSGLRTDALAKVAAGVISLEEADRISPR